MTKYIKKHYDVVEGDVNNEPVSPVFNNSAHVGFIQLSTPIRSIYSMNEKICIVKKLIADGWHIGDQVIRIQHINIANINNPNFIGTLIQFLYEPYIGWSYYYPMLVEFPDEHDNTVKYPFKESEIEKLDKAKLIVSAEQSQLNWRKRHE